MLVRFTDEAEGDLEEIGNFIAEDNPGRAASFVAELVDRCLGLSGYPQRYAIFVHRGDRDIRRFPHGNYVTFYSIVADTVEINHVVHGARDHIRLLFPET
jgi:plasmid stabilization system protein ParE